MLKWETRPYGTELQVLQIGDITLECVSFRKPYKDGTRLWSIWLYVSGADSREVITIAKVRGHLEDARAKAEEFVQRLREDLI
jgi:hypothetical protein